MLVLLINGFTWRSMKIFHRYCTGLLSAWKILCAKVCTYGKVQATWINSIRGALKTEIIGDGHITIGRFLMSKGPLLAKMYSSIIIVRSLVQRAL